MHRGNVFFALALAAPLIAAGTAAAQTLTVSGQVTTPLTLNDSALGGTAASATIGGVLYSGSSVYSLISAANFESNPAQAKNGGLLDYITITNATGQSVVLSEGQLDPGFGGQPGNPQTFIATSANGSPISPRLIVPTDPNGAADGYDVTGVTGISVGWANVPSLSAGALDTETAFTVTGSRIANPPASYNTSNWNSIFPTQTTQTDTFLAGSTPTTDTFTGVPIFDLLENAGLLTDPANPQSILDDYIVVTGSNEPTTGVPDYAVLYSLGEIDPAFNDFTSATEPLLAEVGGATFRSTAPSDEKGGRYDSDVINIDAESVIPEPGTLALMLPPLIFFFALNRRRVRREA